MDDYKENNGLEPVENENVSGGDEPVQETAQNAVESDDNMADGNENNEISDADGISITPQEEEEKEPELCILCEERPADKSFGENYDLCAVCRKSLIKSPLRFSGFLAVVVLFCVCIWGFVFTSSQLDTVSAVLDGDKYLENNNLNRAVSMYSSGGNIGFKTAKKLVNAANKSGYLSSINSAVSTYFYDASALEEGEKLSFADKAGKSNLNAPWNKKVREIYADYNAAMDAYEKYYAFLSQYDEQLYYGTITAEEVPYDDILKQYEEAKAEATESADLAFINYCEYYLAVICQKGTQAQYDALKETARLAPEYDWLYLTPLAELNIRLGNYEEALENCEALEKKNADDRYGEYFRSQINRMQGKYEDALKMAEDMIADYDESGFYYAYYEAAINCMLLGDYKKAKEYNDISYGGEYLNEQTANLQALLCKLTDDEAGYNQVVEMLAGYEIEISPTVEQYLKGEVTAEEMFNEREVAFE